ncbi:hypothetical protein CASFOL_013368 [Castilleja foliolosa]|uniref:Uncharacterized protein n=1 Tax=Castilleja foliolosa TaxID=1961234 RepID=A0ABD3DJR8_9LAMI
MFQGNVNLVVQKDNSFGWGVGVGIMCMMSAGNADISRLNCAMDETVKSVQELKAEISRRNISLNENESGTKFMICDDPSSTNSAGERIIEGDEFARYVTLKEDHQQPEVLEVDRFEAEFESELQKLQWCTTEGSCSEGQTDAFEAEAFAKEERFENSNSYQYNGVLPAVLDGKLRNLIIEQQENQIVELETELHHAHLKLHEKEAELQALKDCVKRLTDFSLANASDEETEIHEEDVKTRRDGIEETLGFELTESTVGIKRTLGYDSYICSKN